MTVVGSLASYYGVGLRRQKKGTGQVDTNEGIIPVVDIGRQMGRIVVLT